MMIEHLFNCSMVKLLHTLFSPKYNILRFFSFWNSSDDPSSIV